MSADSLKNGHAFPCLLTGLFSVRLVPACGPRPWPKHGMMHYAVLCLGRSFLCALCMSSRPVLNVQLYPWRRHLHASSLLVILLLLIASVNRTVASVVGSPPRHVNPWMPHALGMAWGQGFGWPGLVWSWIRFWAGGGWKGDRSTSKVGEARSASMAFLLSTVWGDRGVRR